MSIVPWWLSAAAGAIVALIIGYMAHSLDINRIEAKQESAIEAQKTADITQCNKNTQPAIVSDSDALQSCNNNLNACDNLLRQQPATCVPVYRAASCTKTANSAALRSSYGLTSGAIEAHNSFCKSQIEYLNSAKTWAIQCQKNGTCQ